MTKLWVFDTQNHLEIYAQNQKDAEKQANEITKLSGIDFFLHEGWEGYQEDYDNFIKGCATLGEKEDARL